MYSFLLSLHSAFRWLVLIAFVFALYRAYRGWIGNQPFTKTDDLVRHNTATIAHIQLLIGLTLYFVSPIIDYFFKNFSEATRIREIRFFGMEHSLMMLIAVIVLTIGSAKAKRMNTDSQKFKTMAIWFTVALLIILISVPWGFSPFASRPYWRGF